MWATKFKAVCAKTGELKTYGGPNVPGLTFNMAQDWCYENAGHLEVVGELIQEIPCVTNESGYPYSPDWANAISYGVNLN